MIAMGFAGIVYDVKTGIYYHGAVQQAPPGKLAFWERQIEVLT
jgi:hypothetical protein